MDLPGALGRRAKTTVAALAAGAVAGAALALLWWTPPPGPERAPVAAPAVAPSVSRRATTVSRVMPSTRGIAETPPRLPAIPLPGLLAAAVLPTAEEPAPKVPLALHEAVASEAAVPLTGHPEWMRRLLLWAGRDPDGAAAWADLLNDPDRRREALQAVCFKVAEQDPRAAVEMAQSYGVEDGPGVVENLVAQWAATDATGALGWVDQRPPGGAQEELLARVAFILSASEPGEAVRLIEERMAPGPVQAEAAASVLHQWWPRDAAAAAAWAEGLPEGPLRERAQQEVRGLQPAPR